MPEGIEQGKGGLYGILRVPAAAPHDRFSILYSERTQAWRVLAGPGAYDLDRALGMKLNAQMGTVGKRL